MARVFALADLHLAEPARCDLADLGRPDGYLERQLSGWRKRWSMVATDDHDAVMSAAGAQLERTLPVSRPGTFLHNDFKTDNCQFSPGEPDQVTAVFDWDMATLGDPLADLGTLMNYGLTLTTLSTARTPRCRLETARIPTVPRPSNATRDRRTSTSATRCTSVCLLAHCVILQTVISATSVARAPMSGWRRR